MPLDFASTSLLAHSKFVLNPSTLQHTHQHTLALVRMLDLPSRFNPIQWPSGIWQCDTALFKCSNATLRVLQPVRSSRLRATLCIQTLRSTCTSSSPGEKRERSCSICGFCMQTFLGVCTKTAAISCLAFAFKSKYVNALHNIFSGSSPSSAVVAAPSIRMLLQHCSYHDVPYCMVPILLATHWAFMDQALPVHAGKVSGA